MSVDWQQKKKKQHDKPKRNLLFYLKKKNVQLSRLRIVRRGKSAIVTDSICDHRETARFSMWCRKNKTIFIHLIGYHNRFPPSSSFGSVAACLWLFRKTTKTKKAYYEGLPFIGEYSFWIRNFRHLGILLDTSKARVMWLVQFVLVTATLLRNSLDNWFF